MISDKEIIRMLEETICELRKDREMKELLSRGVNERLNDLLEERDRLRQELANQSKTIKLMREAQEDDRK